MSAAARRAALGTLGFAACARRHSCSAAAGEGVELRFGAIADVQYADVPDAWNFSRTSFRGYRGSLEALRRAVADWVAGPPLAFVADLGDIIDQQCETKGDSREALKRVLDEWAKLGGVQHHHLMGNHELYNFSRAECAALIPNITPWYRSWSPASGWRVVVLDGYQINAIEQGPAGEAGLQYLSQYNKNDLRAPRGTVDLRQGLKGLEGRFMPMGGAVGPEQLQWLHTELAAARKAGERVVLLTHIPIHPGSATPGGLGWDYDDVLAALRRVPPGTVPLVLAGHFHPGGYSYDPESGTHHITLPSPLNDPAGAHCTVELRRSTAVIQGRGQVRSLTLPLLQPQESAARL